MAVFSLRLWAVIVMTIAVATAKPTIRVFPPPNLADIHAWSCRLNNPDSTYHGVWLHAEIYAQRRNWNRVYWVDSREFDLPVGATTKRLRDLEPLRNQHYQKGYEVFFLRSGTIPADSYRYSLTLMPLGIGDTGVIVIRPATPPRLISPRNGDSTDQPRPQFRWAPADAGGRPVRYQLLIYEILPGQTKEEAARANKPVFSQENIATTSFTPPLSARQLDTHKRYAWEIRALDTDGKPIANSEVWHLSVFTAGGGPRPIPVVISRDVIREGNYYRVLLTITNQTTDTMENLLLADRSTGLQCVDDATVQHGTTGAVYRSSSCWVASDTIGPRSTICMQWEKLLPRGRMIIRYHAVPVLTSTDMLTRRIGDSTCLSYSIRDGNYLRRANVPATLSDDRSALAAADYLIVTCPSRLFVANPGSENDVNQLLAVLARLAKEKTGALAFTASNDNAYNLLFSLFGRWGTSLAPDWRSNGYLLLVGQNDIVPSWSAVQFSDSNLTSLEVPLSDYPYSNLSGDEQIELRTGRIIGLTARELIVPVQTSLDVWRGTARYDGTRALYVSAAEGPFENYVMNTREVGESLALRVPDVDRVYGDAYTTRITQLRSGLKIDCGRDLAKLARWYLHELIWNGRPIGTITRHGQVDSMTTAAAIDSAKAISRTVLPDVENDTDRVSRALDRVLRSETAEPRRNEYISALSCWLLRQRGHSIPSDTVSRALTVAEEIRFLRRGCGRFFNYHYYDTPELAGTARSSAVRDSCRERDLVGYRGHGGPGSWAWVLDDWTPSACPAEPLSFGTRRPVVLGFTCSSGDYTQHTGHGRVSIARCFLRNGAGAYIGATRLSYSGPNQRMTLRLVGIWSANSNFGDAFVALKNYALREHGWKLEAAMYNLYGDPKYRRR